MCFELCCRCSGCKPSMLTLCFSLFTHALPSWEREKVGLIERRNTNSKNLQTEKLMNGPLLRLWLSNEKDAFMWIYAYTPRCLVTLGSYSSTLNSCTMNFERPCNLIGGSTKLKITNLQKRERIRNYLSESVQRRITSKNKVQTLSRIISFDMHKRHRYHTSISFEHTTIGYALLYPDWLFVLWTLVKARWTTSIMARW